MRRPFAILAAIALALLTAPPATAQDSSPARLTLVEQTPWNSPKRPALEISVRAENTDDIALEDLSLAVTVLGPVRTRTAYAAALTSDLTAPISQTKVESVRGSLAPGASRTLSASLDVGFLAQVNAESLIYPLRVELRSAGLVAGVLRTPLIFVFERPRTPIELCWIFVLHAPIDFSPDGRFLTPALELDVGRGGDLRAAIAAIGTLTDEEAGGRVTVVVSPVLLEQLRRMTGGYTVLVGTTERKVFEGQGGAAEAGEALEALEQIASSPRVETSALPFSAPDIPSLASGGLSSDLATQLERGRQQVRRLLGTAPSATVFRPPDNALDDTGLRALAARGYTTLLLDAGSAPQPVQPQGFALPPTAVIAPDRDRPVTAVLPDPGLRERLATTTALTDPVLGAQATLGELAAIWLERPSVPRGLAMMTREMHDLPAPFVRAFSKGLATAPWVRPVTATRLVEAFPPPRRAVPLLNPSSHGFDRSYVGALKQARRRIATYRAMLTAESALPQELETTLLLAESSQFLGESEAGGRRFIDHVGEALDSEFAKVRPEPSQVFTLTSRDGSIPVRVENAAGQPMKVTVELVSPNLSFIGGAAQDVKLGDGQSTLTFDVSARTTGRFPVQILVRSPVGPVVGEAVLIVRSTAYNRVALLITLGAALALLGLWARRFLRRKT